MQSENTGEKIMAVRNVSHIALGVTDLDKALTFYRDVLGMTVDADYEQDLPPGGIDDGLNKGRHITRRQVWLRWGGEGGRHAGALTIDQLRKPVPADTRSDIYDLGVHHFAFWVDDIDGVIERARAGGFDVIMPHESPTHYYGEPEGSVIRSVFMRDSDGNVVQCDQRT